MEVDVDVMRTPDGPARRLRLLVDSGASLSIIPRPMLESLGIRPGDEETFEVADGRTMTREVGPAVIRFQGKLTGTQVIFGDPGDAAILGVLALEGLGLELDPRSGRLEKARRLLLAVAG